MVWKPHGILDQALVNEIVAFVEAAEERAQKPFNRFADLSALDAVDLNFRFVFHIALHRRLAFESHPPVKTAFYVTSPAAAHYPKLHAMLTDHSPLHVSLFTERDAAAKWLGVPVEAYGPDAAVVRALLRNTTEEGIQQMWPGQMRRPADRNPDVQAGNLAYAALQQLSPQNDLQRVLKSLATTLAGDVAQTRSLLAAQSVPSVSQPMLIILVSWLVVIFVGFSVLAPPNATTVLALMISALAVSGAIFLILELDQPFGGLIGISSEPMLKALHQLAQ